MVESQDPICHLHPQRLLSRGFSMQAIADQQPLISAHVGLLFQRLHENCGGGKRPINMVTWYNRVTFDIIIDLSWGEPLGSLAKSQDHPSRGAGQTYRRNHLCFPNRRRNQCSQHPETAVPISSHGRDSPNKSSLSHSSPRVVHKGGDVICGVFVPEGVSLPLSGSIMTPLRS